MRDDRPSYHLPDRSRMSAARIINANDQHGQRRVVNTALRMSTRAINGGTDSDEVDVVETRLIKPVSQIRRWVGEF